VARNADRLAAAGVRVLVVVQAEPHYVSPWLARRPKPFPVVSDTDRVAYRAFGLGRVGLLHFFRPGVLVGFVRLMLRGWDVRMPTPGEDVFQTGGDFVLDRRLKVVYAHPSRTATDRPTVEAILTALRSERPCGQIA
jgi:hypothetical protein